MSTNSNTQQINVFNKGMNTDTSDAYISSEQYRYAENLRPVTNEGETSGELRLIEGYKEIEQFLNEQEEVKAVTSIRNLIVILSNDDTAQIHVEDTVTGNTWYPFVAKNEKWDAEHYSLVTRYEDEDNIKLYVADGIHPLRAFTIHNGATNPDSFDDVDTAGGVNIFGGFGEIERISGSIKPAVVQYAYILYTENKGTSSVSPSTQPLSTYENSNPNKGVMSGFNTNVGYRVQINETKHTTPYEKILVYRITYTEVGQQPNIDLLYDDNLDENYYIFTDTGQEPIVSDASFAEFKSYTTVKIIPNYIESKNDYLFAAGINYTQGEDIQREYNKWDASAQITDDGYLDFNTEFPTWSSTDHSLDKWRGNETEHVKWYITYDELSADDPQYNQITDNHTSDKGLWRDEIYRYGIILYDINGYKWPVKWIADIRTPPASVCPIYSEWNGKLYAKPLHIVVCIKDLSSLFPKYEIVRCVRKTTDKHNICQGILGKAMYNDSIENSSSYYPSGLLTMCDVISNAYDTEHNTSVTTKKSNVYQFCSPEISYTKQIQDDISGNSQISVTPVYELTAKVQQKSPVTYMMNNLTTVWRKHSPGDSSITNDSPTPTVIRFGDSGYAMKLITGDSNNPDSLEVSGGNYVFAHPDSGWWQEYENTDITGAGSEKNLLVGKYGGIKYMKVSQNIIECAAELPSLVKNSKSIKSSNFKIIDSPDPFGFSKDEQFTYYNDTTPIKNYNFINWSAAMIEPYVQENLDGTNIQTVYKNGKNHGMGDTLAEEGETTNFYNYVYEYWAYRYPIGSGGRCMIFSSDEEYNYAGSYNKITIANLQNQNVTPYSGIKNAEYSEYSSFGNYFDNDGGEHIVRDGDCCIQLFYYNALHVWYDATFVYAPKMSTVYIVPVETEIDMNSDSGDSYKRNKSRYIQDVPVQNMLFYSQDKNAYMYNTAYSSEPTLNVSSAVSENDINNNRFDYRITYSLQKTNNETTDSWLKFMSANYIDVDTRYGEITDLRLFKNTLMFWQKDATGVLSVNERTMLQDVNETNIILGNGDVLQRYDYLTTEYGMKPNQQVETQSDTTLYWWDEYRKEILMYAGGQSIVPMKKPKQISALINKSTPQEHPKMVYDHKYNEVLMNIVNIPYEEYLKRFVGDLPVDSFDEVHYVMSFEYDKAYPIAYSELIQQFISVYTTPFEHAVTVNGSTYMFNDNKALKWNTEGIDLYPLLRYVVNNNSMFTKTYDNVQLGMGETFYYNEFYNSEPDTEKRDNQPLSFRFRTIGQLSTIDKNITNREYDLRFAVPRDRGQEYGGRMRGKTMQCELTSYSSSTDFSIRYIITKYRISWS